MSNNENKKVNDVETKEKNKVVEDKAKDLASRFNKNFAKYEGNEAGKALVKAGPQLN